MFVYDGRCADTFIIKCPSNAPQRWRTENGGHLSHRNVPSARTPPAQTRLQLRTRYARAPAADNVLDSCTLAQAVIIFAVRMRVSPHLSLPHHRIRREPPHVSSSAFSPKRASRCMLRGQHVRRAAPAASQAICNRVGCCVAQVWNFSS